MCVTDVPPPRFVSACWLLRAPRRKMRKNGQEGKKRQQNGQKIVPDRTCGLKVSEKMPSGGLIKVGEFTKKKKKKATVQSGCSTATAQTSLRNKQESAAEQVRSREASTGGKYTVGSVSATGKRSVICCSHMQVLM